MLIYFLIQIPLMILGALLFYFPKVTELPFGLDPLLTTGFSNFFYIINIIPPLALMWEAFVWVMAFKISIKIMLMIPIVGRMFNR